MTWTDTLLEALHDGAAARFDADVLTAETAALKAAGPDATPAARMRLAGRLAHAAFCAPEHIPTAYDALTAGWSGTIVESPPVLIAAQAVETPPADFWIAYQAVVADAVAGKLDAASITARTADLGGRLSPAYGLRTAAVSVAFPGIAEAVSGPWPQKLSLATLAACPPGSLGRQFHDLIVANHFDLEVLDRDALGLAALPKPLDWLNTRILQAHDLWHIVGGYQTTALHEIAISAFQMAQFGHAYSAHFLAITAGVGALGPAPGYPILMDIITSAWRHGRLTPPLMAIVWETVWEQTPDAIRARFGVTGYDSPYPANLIEMLSPAA